MTDQQWGRRADAGRWMRTLPAGKATAVLLAVATFYVVVEYRRSQWTDVQRHYMGTYLKSSAAVVMELRPLTYDLTGTPSTYENGRVQAYLQYVVYEGQTVTALVLPAALAALLVLAVGLACGAPVDAARWRARRHGRRIKGPEMVPVSVFNARLGGDGIAVRQEGWPDVRIPRAIEAHHVLVLGDTGTGKSSLIRQVLLQIQARGETAVVYDPACEYLPQFYDAARGDQVLNPLDARCPYWTPGDEIRRPEEALTLAAALFPSRPNENPFFTEGPRRIFAYLLTLRPSAMDLAGWLADEAELDRLLAGTPYAAMINPNAPAQRSGVMASLNMQADTLAMLPLQVETTGTWSAAAWAQTRQGWLFFTSGPETRERQIPLMSLWLDLLILRLMRSAVEGRKTWILIDELASLRRLPQLATAMTESRKAQTPIVIGFQARSQLEALYGHGAESMLSQPATKIVLRTSEANSAKWLSDTIGHVEVERMRESRATGWRHSTTFGLERSVEPLVLPSEIEGLSDRTGYLKCQNLVTPLRFPYVQLPAVAPGFIERATGPLTVRVPPSRPVVAQTIGMEEVIR